MLDRYITIDKNDNITFARQRAINDKVDDNIIELGDAIIKYCTGTTKDKKNNVTPLMSFPIHGKYCGPGHSGPGKPIDRLDAVCQKHDYCYHKKGYHKCPCDKAMLKSLKKLLPKLSGTTWLKCKVMIWWLGKKTSKVTKKGGAFSCRR